MQRILLVDDDPTHLKLLRFLLEDEGYQVETTHEASEGLRSLELESPDLIIMEVVLPDLDGLEFCRRIRHRWTTPILFISRLGDVKDTINGLRAGGDDYVAKPFDPNEVLARIWALLRRGGQFANSESHLKNADLTLDPTHNTVALMRTGKIVVLTPTESRLLGFLMSNAGRSLTRDALVIKVWGYEFDRASNQLDVYISRLRNKIEQHPSEPRLIVTVRGIGYRFQPSAAHEKTR